MRKMELLSPAGGMDALHAAVQNGADAVYIGAKSFSARQGAENFDDFSLREAVEYAHQRDCLVYLAMNTLVNKKEIKNFEQGVVTAAQCGADALIIQDFGAGEIAKQVCPKMPIHASTQMSAHNEYDVEYLLKRGFSRIVLARELKKEEIERIYRNTNASLEVFVHGALCVSVSGQCLMSSFIGGRSGNRGRCAQPCRQLYSCGGKNGYYLSTRDLCLLDEIKSLESIGVDSLKIEGRMKSAEYVAAVTGMYRKYLDHPSMATRKDILNLEKIFVRGDGFTKAYFANINTPEMMNYSMSNDNISYKSDKEAVKSAASTFMNGVENKKINISACLIIKEGEAAQLTLSDGKFTVTENGNVPQQAVNIALSNEKAREFVSKLGQTPFVLNDFKSYIDQNVTMSAKDINELRRSCVNRLIKLRSSTEIRETNTFKCRYTKKNREKIKISACVMNEEQLQAAIGADLVYMPISLYEKSEKQDNYAVILPKVIYDVPSYFERLKKSGAVKVAASTYGIAKKLLMEGFECIGDYGLNIYNPVSAIEYKKEGITHMTLSPELTCEEIKDITKNSDGFFEILAYGRMQMMTTRACIIKGMTNKCDCTKPRVIRDKTGAEFLVYGDSREHINTIYNTAVTFMADKMNILETLDVDMVRLVFTDESKDRVKEIINMYKGNIEINMPRHFTRGYFSNRNKK